MASTIIVTSAGEVERGTAIPSNELIELRDFLHSQLSLCQDALRFPAAGETASKTQSGSGRFYSIGDDWAPEQCEFCTHYAARILAQYKMHERG